MKKLLSVVFLGFFVTSLAYGQSSPWPGSGLPGTKTGNTNLFSTWNGALTNGDCVGIDASGNLVDEGGPCTTGGGGGTVVAGTSGQMAGYNNNSATVYGNPNLIFSSGQFTFGQTGTAGGSVVLSGSASGKVTIQPQAAAGTYNFNLPTTSGAANSPLLSGGGGASPMIWGTLSGNTTKLATVNNTLTNGHCLAADGSGNVVDNGTVCGTVTGGTAGGDLTGSYPNPTVSTVGGKSISLGGAFSTPGAFSFSGSYSFAGTLTGPTSVTFPTSGTLLSGTRSGNSSIFVTSGSPFVAGDCVTSDANQNLIDAGFPCGSGGGGSGTGTVTSVSIATANGFTGSVTSASTTPNITVGTTVIGALKGSAGAVSQAACADLSDGGTACSKAIGTSGANVPLMSTANSWTLSQTFLAQLLGPDGSVGAPSYSFTNSSDTGLLLRSAATHSVDLRAGSPGATSNGGGIRIIPGSGGATSGNGGALTLDGGNATDGNGGAVTVIAGLAGTTTSANRNGGSISFTAGSATNSGTGGNVTIIPGSSPSGTNGSIILQDAAGAQQGSVTTSGLSLGTNGGVVGSLILNGNTSGNATITVPAAAGSTTFKLPATNGSNGNFLQTDGSGNLSWNNPAGGGTVNSGTSGQLTYYAASSNAVSSAANTGISGGTLTLGTLNTTQGAVVLDGSSSGAVTVQPAAASGTYNFNLPTAAGSSGAPLVSGGGGSNSMTWGGTTGSGNFVLSASPTITGTATVASATLSGILTTTQVTETAVNLGASVSGATSIDLSTGTYFYGTIAGSTTLSVTNTAASGKVSSFVLELTNAGTNITWMSGTKWPGGSAPTLQSSGTDILVCSTRDAGTTWRCVGSELNTK